VQNGFSQSTCFEESNVRDMRVSAILPEGEPSLSLSLSLFLCFSVSLSSGAINGNPRTCRFAEAARKEIFTASYNAPPANGGPRQRLIRRLDCSPITERGKSLDLSRLAKSRYIRRFAQGALSLRAGRGNNVMRSAEYSITFLTRSD